MKSLFLLLLWSLLAIAADPPKQVGIPNRYMNDAAIDLVKDGKMLLPDDVQRLIEESKGRFDISTLNPDETSDLWKNTFVKTLPEEKDPIKEMEEVSFHSSMISPSGIYRFNVLRNGKLSTMMLGKTIHSVLLTKSLLRKIGYQIPDINYVPRVSLKFKSEAEKKGFISYLGSEAMAGSAKSWIVDDLGDNRLLLQDLLIMDSTHVVYSIAVNVDSGMIQGRRLLSSLAVPMAIVNLTESVNMLRWSAGALNNNKIILYLDNLDDYQCSWDDARWISRRIEKLTRQDWKDIVETSHLPKAVQTILLEKLISRRNSIMKLFKIDAEELKVDSKVSNGVELYEGKLTQQEWPGYASRFAYGDPESPLSDSEIKSWIKSKAVSTVIDIAMGQINQLPFMGTDVEAMNTQEYKEHFATAVQKAVAQKKNLELPVQSWIFPTFRGHMIFSRNLVTGTYLGTDGLLQLVDTVGAAFGAGAFMGTIGIPTPFTAFAAGEAMLMRTYAHLRPVTKIEQALKYKFKNVFVPLVKMDYGKKLHEAVMTTLDPNASNEVKAAKVEAALKPLKDAIQVGESLLVTDSFGAYVGGEGGVGFKKLINAALSITPGSTITSRFHVHRKSDDEFHVYKDLGIENSYNLSFELNSLIPVLKASLKKSDGHARVKFYSLNLNPKNSEALKNASALRRAIIHSSTKELDDEDQAPYVIKHSFKESTPSLDILFWHWLKLDSSTDISITNPKGDTRNFHRHYLGETKGRNYQVYANSLISHWVDLLFKKKAGLSESTSSNPGYSFKGVAKTKFLTLDEEIDSQGKVMDPFVRLSRIWNGWSVDRERAQEILEEMKAMYRYEFFNAPILNDTHQIFLYNISLNMLIYKAGIEHLMNLSEDEIKTIFVSHKSQKSLVINPEKVAVADTKVRRFLRLFKKFKKFEQKSNIDKANKFLLKAIAVAEKNLYLAGMVKLVGGPENIYVTAKIDGFREGDEDGNRSIVSSSLGESGSPMTLGPIVQMQTQTNMLEGEFFIYWLMTRLI